MRLIDADVLLKKAHQITTNTGFGAAIVTTSDIDYTPTVNPDSLVKHGRWIAKEEFGNPFYAYECSECNHFAPVTKTPYCPNCGAKMED